MTGYLQIYNLESYLFDTVSPGFHRDGKLSAFDFFCIVIWKANRAKSRVAQRLLKKDRKGRENLVDIVEELTGQIYRARENKERMRILIEEWEFRLPMASAILTVLYPNDFSIYDVRVCNVLKDYHKLQNCTRFDDLWKGYERFIESLTSTEKAPSGLSLRDKDRHLWGMSFCNDLEKDIQSLFAKNEKK
jgi:hypothetical protein